MNFERLALVKAGKYSESDFWYDFLTDLGGSLFAYMTMLRLMDRSVEHTMFDRYRNVIFQVRTAVACPDPSTTFLDLQKVCWEINHHYELLRVFKPEEAAVLQSAANNALWLAHKDSGITSYLNRGTK